MVSYQHTEPRYPLGIRKKEESFMGPKLDTIYHSRELKELVGLFTVSDYLVVRMKEKINPIYISSEDRL